MHQRHWRVMKSRYNHCLYEYRAYYLLDSTFGKSLFIFLCTPLPAGTYTNLCTTDMGRPLEKVEDFTKREYENSLNPYQDSGLPFHL